MPRAGHPAARGVVVAPLSPPSGLRGPWFALSTTPLTIPTISRLELR